MFTIRDQGASNVLPRRFVTLNTPHTKGKSDKIICKTIMIIGTLPRIVGRGKICPIILWRVPSIRK